MAFRIEHRIGVAAPADVIWDLLADVDGWSRWNPLYPEASGQLRIGGALRLTEAVPGRPPKVITPTIVDWEPRAQILWRHDGGFMARCVRYLEIEALSETGCIFSNGAFFHGLLGEQAAKGQQAAIRKGYEGLGEAVKRLSEQAYKGGEGAA